MKVFVMPVLFLLIPTAAFAQTPSAADVLADSAGLLVSASPFRIEGTTIQELIPPSRQSQERISFSIVAGPGGRYRHTVGILDNQRIEVSDGTSVWRYAAAANTWSKSLATGEQAVFNLPELRSLRLGQDASNITSAAFLRQETVAADGKPVVCDVIRSTYRSVPWAPGARDAVRTTWLARGSHRVVRDSWEIGAITAGSPSGVRTTVDYSVFEPVAQPDPQLFTFNPPENSREVVVAPRAFVPPALTSRPVLTRRVTPEFTQEAKAAGYAGTAIFSFQVSQAGKPGNIRVIQSVGYGLQEKALEALRRFEYTPGPSNSAAPNTFVAEVPFSLAPENRWNVRRILLSTTPNFKERVETMERPEMTTYASPDATACGEEAGYALVRLEISDMGAPERVSVSQYSSDPLRRAAEEAARKWVFAPGTINGERHAGGGVVQLECGLKGPSPNTPGTEAAQPFFPVGGGVTAPSVLYKTDPEYSEEARKAKYSGSTLLSVVVNPDGRASDIYVVRALGMGLDEKAIEAVMQWLFKPGLRGGTPVRVKAQIEVNFRLL